MMPHIRTPYDETAREASDNSSIDFTVKKDSKGKVLNPEVLSLTRQSEKDSCDINLIVRQAEQNGGIILNNNSEPVYGDFTNLGDWLEINMRVSQAKRSFMLLPVEIRNRFDNDPGKLAAFLSDSKNHKEAVAMKIMPIDILKTALADDGITRITPEERIQIDKDKAATAAASGASGTGTQA